MGIVVSLSHVVSATPSSSHCSPAPMWGPSHGRQSYTNFFNVGPSHRLQLFKNCSSVCPFHRVQSFRNRLLQLGSPMGSQALTANLLWHGLLSLWVHRSCQEPAPARGLHEVTASNRAHPPALVWVPAWAAGGYLLHHGPPWASEESLLWCLEHFLLFLLH